MPTIKTYNCSSNQSSELAYERPYPCCGWSRYPRSFSGRYTCVQKPGFPPTTGCDGTEVAITLTPTSYCGNLLIYFSVGAPVYLVLGLPNLCSYPTGYASSTDSSAINFALYAGPDSDEMTYSCLYINGKHIFNAYASGGASVSNPYIITVTIDQVTP
jgi:hypothetical protein